MAMFRIMESEGEGQQELNVNDPEVRKIHSEIQVLMLARSMGTERDVAKELKWVDTYSEAFAKYMKMNPHMYHSFKLDPQAAIEQIEHALYGDGELRQVA